MTNKTTNYSIIDTIPEVDNEEQMRDAIAEALGGTREQLDPQLSTEFLVRYFFLSPMVPPEKPFDVGDIILDFNSKKSRQFRASEFVQLPEQPMAFYLNGLLQKWGYPPNYPWTSFGESFHGVRKARRWFREQEVIEERNKNPGFLGERLKRKVEEDGEMEGPRPKRARTKTEMVDHASSLIWGVGPAPQNPLASDEEDDL